jgi:hypothetical protein
MLCDNEEEATVNCYENSAIYVFLKSNSSQYKVSSNHITVARHCLVVNSQLYSLKYVCLQAQLTTKYTKFLFCWYVVTTNIDNTLNTNRNNLKLFLQKINPKETTLTENTSYN